MATSIPPPEQPEAVRNRAWIIYSFWVVIVLLGLPMWWQTTSIPRAALPLEDMLAWSDPSVTKPTYTVPVRIAAPELSCDVSSKVVAEIQSLLSRHSSSWGFQVSVEQVRFQSVPGECRGRKHLSCAVRDVSSSINDATVDIELVPGSAFSFGKSPTADLMVVTYATTDWSALAKDIANALSQALEEEKAAVSYQYLNHGNPDPQLFEYANNLPGETRRILGETAARAFKASPGYHLTFSLFTPGGFPSSWDIETAMNQHIRPLLHALSGSTSFSVTTQVQLYSSFSPSIQPYQEESGTGWLLRKQDLTAFVNTAEWPLSPSIGNGPTINFVLYIPSKQYNPLRVEGIEGKSDVGGSWIIPQWGGISILNAPVVQNDPEISREDTIARLSADLLQPAFRVFQDQLLSLLGVPSISHIPLPLRLKAFQRLSALSLHLRTTSNLGSLARLVQHLSNIPIPHHVSDLVNFAVNRLTAYKSGKLEDSQMIVAAKQGYKASERAFFDKAMVGQVYFPDEHKVAVYLPLLGPIGVPLLVGLIRELKALAAKLKS